MTCSYIWNNSNAESDCMHEARTNQGLITITAPWSQISAEAVTSTSAMGGSSSQCKKAFSAKYHTAFKLNSARRPSQPNTKLLSNWRPPCSLSWIHSWHPLEVLPSQSQLSLHTDPAWHVLHLQSLTWALITVDQSCLSAQHPLQLLVPSLSQGFF